MNPEHGESPSTTAAPRRGAVIVRLTPERRLEHAMATMATRDGDRCSKCDSRFVRREPAFLHCRYCGKMARLAGASLLDQELFELRSGLRIAS